MNESQWLSSSKLRPMLEFLRGRSERKLRLFGVACCRRIWTHLKKNRHKNNCGAVEMAERFADGLVTAIELARLREEAGIKGAAHCACDPDPWWAALTSARRAAVEAVIGNVKNSRTVNSAFEAEEARQTQLLRDIFGLPFHSAPTLAPAVLAWNDGTVRKIAQAIYDERAFDRLPILADALEDAGCDDADILSHCREPGIHMRGCWVVDLLLGKQ